MFIATFKELNLKMSSYKTRYHPRRVRYSERHVIERYKMRSCICCGGYSMPVALCWMKGDYDDYKLWLFSKPVSFIIIHPDDDNRNYKMTLTHHLSLFEEFPDFQKLEGYNDGHGFDNFMTFKSIMKLVMSNKKY